MAIKDKNILFVGCGNMGNAILQRLQVSNSSNQYYVVDPNFKNPSRLKVTALDNVAEIDFEPDVIFLCVKPQVAKQVLLQYRVFNKAIFVSIIAGKNLNFYTKILGSRAKIVRTMPNLPVSVGKGVVSIKSINLNDVESLEITLFLEPLGKVFYLKNEDDFHAYTALAGSGPAYYFMFMQYMYNKAIELGLSEKDAIEITAKTGIGATEYSQSDEVKAYNFQQLKENVTSKGGTTAAALEVFDKANVEQIISDAIDAAIEQGKELEG